MAYVSQDLKKKVEALLKPVLKKHGLKGSLRVDNHSSLRLTISGGVIDFAEGYSTTRGYFEEAQRIKENLKADMQAGKFYVQVNPYWLDSHWQGKALEALQEINAVMFTDHWDKSDIQSDYFCCSHYVHIHIGRWNKGYKYAN